MSRNLLLRLESYSQNPAKRALENFTTEVMAHLINEDPAFCRMFVRHVVHDGRLLRTFSHARAETQRHFGSGIVDLVLRGKQQAQILVEVKITAQETWTRLPGRGWLPQIRKYLSYRQGPVVYLSTKGVKTPDVISKRFLGHRYLEDLYAKLSDEREYLTEIGRMFLEFMEEHQMVPVRPFNKTDLRVARRAFRFAFKCEGILKAMMRFIEPQFKKVLRSRTSFTDAHFSPTYRSVYSWSKRFTREDVTRVIIWLEPWYSELDFGVEVAVRNSNQNIKRLNRHLNWKTYDNENRLSTCHQVRDGTSIQKMATIVIKDLRSLRRGLSKVRW